MKIFVTGHRGYIGTVLTRMLFEQNFDVVGCDIGYYPQGFVVNKTPSLISLKKDIRDLTKNDLKDCNAVLHLAALSNDPLGEINPSLTHDINFLATVRIAKIAKAAGIERFVFSSSCSSYGATNGYVDETSKLAPLTAYAKSKVESERALLKLKDDKFFPVILRNSTVYGISPSQRLDLVVNNLVGSAVATGKIQLLSDGSAWRPLLHVEDIANAFIKTLESSQQEINGECFNVGSNEDNYTVREIAEKIGEVIPGSEIEFTKGARKDNRSYRVNFNKIKETLGFQTVWKLKKGISHIYNTLKNKEFSEADFKDKSFYRVAYLRWLINNRILDSNLKFKKN